MTYVRIDTETQYIYFENDTLSVFNAYDSKTRKVIQIKEMRSQYTLRTHYPCIRMTKKRNIPLDKKCKVWYTKSRK